jgi:hypothetical protein
VQLTIDLNHEVAAAQPQQSRLLVQGHAPEQINHLSSLSDWAI